MFLKSRFVNISRTAGNVLPAPLFHTLWQTDRLKVAERHFPAYAQTHWQVVPHRIKLSSLQLHYSSLNFEITWPIPPGTIYNLLASHSVVGNDQTDHTVPLLKNLSRNSFTTIYTDLQFMTGPKSKCWFDLENSKEPWIWISECFHTNLTSYLRFLSGGLLHILAPSEASWKTTEKVFPHGCTHLWRLSLCVF